MRTREEWYQRCARCGAWTAPVDRERRRCRGCGRDPRPTRTKAAHAVWAVGITAAVVVAAPGILIALAALAIAEDIGRDGDGGAR